MSISYNINFLKDIRTNAFAPEDLVSTKLLRMLIDIVCLIYNLSNIVLMSNCFCCSHSIISVHLVRSVNYELVITFNRTVDRVESFM